MHDCMYSGHPICNRLIASVSTAAMHFPMLTNLLNSIGKIKLKKGIGYYLAMSGNGSTYVALVPHVANRGLHALQCHGMAISFSMGGNALCHGISPTRNFCFCHGNSCMAPCQKCQACVKL